MSSGKTSEQVPLLNVEQLRALDEKENAERRKKHASTKEKLDDSLLEFLSIPDSLVSQVKVFDEVDGMLLVHYIDEPPHPSLQRCRGLVLERNSTSDWGAPEYIEVCRSFPFTPEISEVPTGNEFIKSAHWSEEGTVLRVFWNNERWYISSHRLIDCTNRRWSSKKNFGELFDDCVPRSELSSVLDKNFVYVFLLQHPENRIVSNFETPRLLHVQTLRSNGETLEEAEHILEHPNITYPEAVNLDENLAELAQNPPQGKNGILFSLQNGTYSKVVSAEYTRKRNIRGNEPSLSLRYLNLSKLESKRDSEELLQMFPERKKEITEVQEDIERLNSYLYSLYRQRYISKESTILPKDEHNIIKFTRDKVYNQVQGRFSQYSFSDLAEITRNEISRQIAISNPQRLLRMTKNMNEALSA
ncbi:putative RNA ligase [Tokyovirus A1]|uniref:putative RNA ligase n=1 Tax=Tokyovirus A1 TaxID=1826170 RepID=UPI0007A9799D|nr:putative RNA ligase [Tokyovirus A1]BAU80108.1 putative RNA ligase [Tokyovirus A1]